MKVRSTFLAASLFGATGVALGAFGAHALRDTLTERGMTSAWETAARYQMFHAIALLAAGAWMKTAPEIVRRRIGWATLAWSVGLILFAGSLYGMALGGPRWLGPVTPLGGIALLGGWIALGAAALAKEP